MNSGRYPGHTNPLLDMPDRPLPREIAIIGAGTIGPDIGYYFKSAMPDLRLILVDVFEKPLHNAGKRIEVYIQKALDRKKITHAQAEAIGENIFYTIDYGEIKDADLVIEAATENLQIKQRIVDQVENLVRTTTIVTSNTSSIPAERIFANAQSPDRTTITHFFAPAWRNPAVEVITWKGVDPKIVNYLRWMFCQTGKVPITSRSEICFILDRIFDNWCNDAALILDLATAPQIDQVAQEFVFAGPFSVLNLAHGNPIVVETNTLQMEEGSHYRPANILRSVEKWVTPVALGTKGEVDAQTAAKVRDRLLGVLFSQSFDVINRGIGTLEDLNLGCQIALGFRKGPFDIMRDLGEKEVKRITGAFQDARPGMPGMDRDYRQYQGFRRTILLDEIDGVKIITIRRPHLLNALNEEVNNEILEVLKAYETDASIRGFVIVGYGNRAFSAGAEIGKFSEVLGNGDASAQYSRDCSRLLYHMDRLDRPVVAAINGMALGGGFELAIRCHGIVATRTAWFQFPEVTLGILPGIGGMVIPYRRWPQGSAVFHDMIRLAKRLSAEKAREIGIVTTLCDDYHGLIEAAVTEVKRFEGHVPRISDHPVKVPVLTPLDKPMAGELPLSRQVVKIITEAIPRAAAAPSLEGALEIGYRAFGDAARTPAAREGISAFMEKRSPRFED